MAITTWAHTLRHNNTCTKSNMTVDFVKRWKMHTVFLYQRLFFGTYVILGTRDTTQEIHNCTNTTIRILYKLFTKTSIHYTFLNCFKLLLNWKRRKNPMTWQIQFRFQWSKNVDYMLTNYFTGFQISMKLYTNFVKTKNFELNVT